MIRAVLLDSGPLGMIAHAQANTPIASWAHSLLAAGTIVVVPEVTDYEVRRELIRAKLIRSIQKLDNLNKTFVYLPITTEAMLAAAQLWADMRSRGRPTSGKNSLDADAILAAQANTLRGREVQTIVATDNVQHLNQMTHAEYWHDILVDG